ncbi:endonuclease 5 [Natronomonas moolapensis 8.8.11]|uniref:Endonuclease V n=1 Tax=Natronomonas moolapensis (strain DSM 18674 / CECT 7526 / JCM 14361 / 8.8.11) TaxID=268739 RepID=M1XPB3_NATM8|nr:endonuclease V [Natronomonas moolapensis]CCQ35858.1 endonuclease 5 [Natronomonas moolapensis 8.8.11]
MDVAAERFRPTRPGSREAMERLQAEIAAEATFEDAAGVTPADVHSGDALVAGVDQAFLDDRAVSAVVVLRGGEVIARESAVTPLSMPYVPGLLAFREGEPIVAALEALDVDPDLLVLDGSGRIHYREAGLAAHVGVCFDVPAVGVAKSLLCGRPRRATDALEAGERVPIEADDSMSAPEETVVGHAYQSRQYPDSTRINPLYVSPGHRLAAGTATDLVAACGGEYKLPRPTRLADRYADELKTGR